LADQLPKIQRIAAVARAFTPGAPINELDLFAGRWDQTHEVVSAVSQRGYHAGLYGERGVGKTSLANVLAEIFAAEDIPRFQSALVNCSTDDTFDSLWRNIFRDLRINGQDEYFSPEDVRHEVQQLEPPALIVVDELDRLEDNTALTLLADTIKTLSDHSVRSTVVLVGVARSLGDLIGEHESIVRNIAQIEMPRMSQRELAEILEKGCAECDLSAHPAAVERIVSLSEGLPHYTHLLALHAGQHIVKDDRTEITIGDVNAAIPLAVARHTIQSDYLQATRSTKADNLYPQVLLACALAQKNSLGYFTAGAIRDPLEVIAGRRIDIPAFARHLKQFLEPKRGAVLQREGEPRRYFYRFTDPILQPFVILRGLSEGLISDEQLTKIQGQSATARLTDDEPNVPQQLF
jgi:Cdc6-like AAA superfamily ATPase